MDKCMLSDNKSIFDLFNMVNPNCYQACAIQSVIANDKDLAIKYCDELENAIKYYKWDKSDKNTDYIDSLICQSNLEKWQKLAIMYILGNNTDKCKDLLINAKSSKQFVCHEDVLKNQNDHGNVVDISNYSYNDLQQLREQMLHESIMNFLHPSNVYPHWIKLSRSW